MVLTNLESRSNLLNLLTITSESFPILKKYVYLGYTSCYTKFWVTDMNSNT